MNVIAKCKEAAAELRAELLLKLICWVNGANKRYMIEYRPDFHFNFKNLPDYSELFSGWLAGNRLNNCADLTRFYTLYLNADKILRDGVAGAIVELGVYRGNSAVLLAKLGRQYRRQVYLFDTFSGFDARDLRGVDSAVERRFSDTSMAAVQGLVGTDRVTYVAGFFPESVSQINLPEQIAIAHMDCDLYEPTKAGLACFYPRLSPGGILLLHDYCSGYWPGATRAIDEFFEQRPEKPTLVADKSGSAIIRKLST